MKNLKSNKTRLLKISIIVPILIISACSNYSKQEDTKEIAEDKNDAKFDNERQEKDAQFLVNAAEVNLEEVKLAKLAQEKGLTTLVKDLGKMMEEAHSKSFADLSVLAKTKVISIPTAATQNAQDAYNNLNDKSGTDFDKAYLDLMISKHKDAVETFEKATEDTNDADIKNWAAKSLPELRKHLDYSLDSQSRYNNL